MNVTDLPKEQHSILTQLRKLQRGKHLQTRGLSEKLAQRTQLPTPTILSALKELRRLNLIDGSQRWDRTLGGRLWLTEQGREAPSDYQQALGALQLPADQRQFLADCEPALSDWPLDNLPLLLEGVLALKAALPDAYQLTRFEASSRYLLCSAKLLDALPKKALQRLGIDRERFATPASFVLAEGCYDPRQVLLIENPQSFHAALNAGLHEFSVLVCSFGYGLSIDNILADPQRHRLFSQHSQLPSLPQLLEHPKLLFWGDLDYEGLKIFQTIRSRHPHCKLSRLYQPMLAKLEKGHPLCQATGKRGQRTGDALSVGGHAVDQEALQLDEIRAFGQGALAEDLNQKTLAITNS